MYITKYLLINVEKIHVYIYVYIIKSNQLVSGACFKKTVLYGFIFRFYNNNSKQLYEHVNEKTKMDVYIFFCNNNKMQQYF